MTDNNQQVNEQDEWRVGEFWSSASPGKKVLILSRADQIGSDSGHKDFIRWVVGSRAALAHPVGQQAGKGGISQSAPSSAPAADRAQSGKAAAANAGDVGDGAAMLAEIFNRLTQEQKLSVPQVIAGRIGEYMVRNGYRIVFGRWYLQAEADRAAVKGTDGQGGAA